MNIYFYIAEFIITFIIVLLYYKFIETKKIKKYTKNNLPTDLKLFIYTQKIDVKKISYKKLMTIVAITNAIDIAILVLLTNITENIFLKMAIAIPMAFIMLFVSYTFVGFILKMKGLDKNES